MFHEGMPFDDTVNPKGDFGDNSQHCLLYRKKLLNSLYYSVALGDTRT